MTTQDKSLDKYSANVVEMAYIICNAEQSSREAKLHGYQKAAKLAQSERDVTECVAIYKQKMAGWYDNADSLKTACNKYKCCILLMMKHPVPDATKWNDTSYDGWSDRHLLKAAKAAGIIKTKGTSGNTGKVKAVKPSAQSKQEFITELEKLRRKYAKCAFMQEVDAMIARIEKKIS